MRVFETKLSDEKHDYGLQRVVLYAEVREALEEARCSLQDFIAHCQECKTTTFTDQYYRAQSALRKVDFFCIESSMAWDFEDLVRKYERDQKFALNKNDKKTAEILHQVCAHILDIVRKEKT